MFMSTKFKILAVLVSLSLTLCFMSNTYSRYVANTTGNVEVQFAKWQILVNENDITTSSSSSIELTPVVEQNQYVADNKVAPSSKGYFDIDIDPTNVEVSFDYSISLTIENTNIPDLMITKYSIVDSSYDEDKDELQINNIKDNTITGSLTYDNKTENFKFEPFTIRIYFEWYEGTDEIMNDLADSEVGNDASNHSLKLNANIKFEQKLGVATPAA